EFVIHPDNGMDWFIYYLAFSRRAPVQSIICGHPDTSGLPTIYYFLSSALIEAEDADTHYTEELIRLPSLPTYYRKPTAPAKPKTRADLGLPDDKVLYLCPQSLFKLHPDFDGLLRTILEAVPNSWLVLLEGHDRPFTTQMILRFAD